MLNAVQPQTILMFDGRPCVITGTAQQRHRNPAHGYFQVELIRFLDGEQPGAARVPRGKFKTGAKRPPPAQQAYWWKVDRLVASGKPAAVAKREALAAEVAGGGKQQTLLEW
jgi:hypothetical protein